MLDEIKNQAQRRMERCIEAFKQEIGRVRTGRAHPTLLEGISVDYYGVATSLRQLAHVVAEDSRTLAVTVYDRQAIHAVEKAILTADLGFNPLSAGNVLRIPLPPLTEERRKELIKRVKAAAEHGRISIRNVRRDANEQIKAQLKEKILGEDEDRRAQEEVQKLTDEMIKRLESTLQEKERELVAV